MHGKSRLDGVRNPGAFTLAELKKMPTETVTMVLQCSGNGRGMFSKPSGTPWQVGAAGCVMWTSGVPAQLARALGGTDAVRRSSSPALAERYSGRVRNRVERSALLGDASTR